VKAIIKSCLVLVLIFLGFSCNKDEVEPGRPEAIEAPLTEMRKLISIAPLTGPKETLVTIKGKNFGTDGNRIRVLFNDKEASLEAVSDTELSVIVPAKAFSGKVKVIVGETVLSGPDYTYQITEVQVTTFAGSSGGYANGSAENAKFKYPRGIAMDTDGNLYIADRSNHRIRKITPSGVVSTLAGKTLGDQEGIGENAQLGNPSDIAIDRYGQLYVTDSNRDKIWHIDLSAAVTTLAGGIEGDSDGRGVNARLNSPRGIAIGADGAAYFSDSNNNKLCRITANGEVSTLAGSRSGDADGTQENAEFNNPRGVASDTDGNLYVADRSNDRIRKISPSGVVSTIAGKSQGSVDGPVSSASFNNPRDLTVDPEGNIYVADSGNNRIRKISPDGVVSTLAGSDIGNTDGVGAIAKFNKPIGILIDEERTLFVVDNLNHRIRKITQE